MPPMMPPIQSATIGSFTIGENDYYGLKPADREPTSIGHMTIDYWARYLGFKTTAELYRHLANK